MSNKRHPGEPRLRGYAVTHPPGSTTLPTQPGWDQLIYTATGSVSVQAGFVRSTVPPQRALWVPDGTTAVMTNRYRAAVRTLYFDRDLEAAPTQVEVIAVQGFPRELLLHVVQICPLYDEADTDRALLTVLLDQLHGLPGAGLQLPVPHDEEMRCAAELLRAEPALPLADAAARLTTRRRTLERRLLQQTGMNIGLWRRRARIHDSLQHLAAAMSIEQVSALVGYANPSAYVTAFRRELGCSPRKFLHHNRR